MYYTRTKLEKINPENFLRNAKQEFPCQSLESFSGEYYNMENKILDFQFGPVCANQIRPGYCSVGATGKNVKRYQPIKNACVKKFR